LTLLHRPDLLKQKKLTKEEQALFLEIQQDRVGDWEVEAIEKGKKFTQGKS
jgi:hypothetical protein